MSIKLPLNNLIGVVPGNTAVLTVGQKGTIDKIHFQLSGGMTASHIESIRGLADGRVFMEQTGPDAVTMDSYRGIATDAAFITLDFTEPRARNGASEQLLASIPNNLLQSLQFEIKVAAAAPAIGKIAASAEMRPATANPNIRKLMRNLPQFPAVGDHIMFLPVGSAGGKIKRLWIKESSAGGVTKAQIRIGTQVLWEADRATIEYEQKRNELLPQAGWLVLDFIEDGNLSAVFPTDKANEVQVILTSTAAQNYVTLTEYVDPIGRI